MTETEVLRLIDRLTEADVGFWLEGGWGVDALLGHPTREHMDVDLVIEARDEHTVRTLLHGDGFRQILMPFTTAVHTVWQHPDGRIVDLHVIVLNSEGAGVFGDEGLFPAAGLGGVGSVAGRRVRCISPEVQVEFHRGYEVRDRDRHDVAMLCERFGLALPPEFA
ncbi:nucleotidyltransferase domain-containing protein [Microbacteriaceae bacterium 4G12]